MKFPKPQKRVKARKPLRRTRMKRRPPRRLRKPGSDPAYLDFVRSLPCAVKGICTGSIHAHHAGRRPGVSMKAPDDTAIPLCAAHHDAWHSATGVFFGLTKMQRFAWAVQAIADTQGRYAATPERSKGGEP